MHDFRPHALLSKQVKQRPEYTFTSGGYVYEAVTPGDLATIYNLTPLFANGNTGAGQTIALIEDADLYTSQDWNTFRSTFGLSQYTSGSLTTVHPSGSSLASNCADPGLGGGDDSEATLDAEWASAAAPDASIQVVSCASSRTTFGGMIAITNVINSANPPQIMSISYGQCEAENGASANGAFSLAFQQAVAEGISVFVAAGDEAARPVAMPETLRQRTALASVASLPRPIMSPSEAPISETPPAALTPIIGIRRAAPTTLPLCPTFPKFHGTIPAPVRCSRIISDSPPPMEPPDSAAAQTGSAIIRTWLRGAADPVTALPEHLPSLLADVRWGSCKGAAKPSWQTGAGVPGDGVRDLPDVSMFAADGVWGHYLVFCFSDTKNGGASCAGDPSNWAGGGGTSFASPMMAGIQALVNQNAGGAQGNPNYVYYQLAANGSCNSSDGDSSTSSCIFHNVTRGDIDVNCGGSTDCYGATAAVSSGGRRGGFGGGGSNSSNGNGALSVSTQSFSPAYGTGGGWSFATGNGSVNAANLVQAWSSVQK